jgi:transcriptional regulator with XRE-family HTH domain
MSLYESFQQVFLDKVRTLSQEDGWKDHEIAEYLGCSRATVNRTRQAHDIPTANLSNRKDKECYCEGCHKVYFIRRKERRKKRCFECTNPLHATKAMAKEFTKEFQQMSN